MLSVSEQRDLEALLPVCEMFESMQGEGIYTGSISTFIRLQGCNMTPPCAWCDTAYAQMTVREQCADASTVETMRTPVSDIVEKVRTAHVVVTGGEPLIHGERLAALCRQFYGIGCTVTVESNATIYLESLRWCVDLMSLSPKLPSSGHIPDYNTVLAYVDHADHFWRMQLKFVIQDTADLDCAEALIAEVQNNSVGKRINYVLQPQGNVPSATGPEEAIQMRLAHLKLLYDAVAKRKLFRHIPDLQVLPQMHRLLWGDKRGV